MLLMLCFVVAQADEQVMGLLAVPVQRAFALSDQGMNIGQLADELGYASASAFGKMFAKQFGRAPRKVLGGLG